MSRSSPTTDTQETPAAAERRNAQEAQRRFERQITDRLPVVSARHPLGVVRQLISNYRRDDGDGMATIIAYSALFSILPILFVMYALLSFTVKSDMILNEVDDLVQLVLPQGASGSVMHVIERSRNNAREIGMVAFISFVVGGSRLFGALDRTLATVNHVERRPWLRRKLISLVMVPLMALLMIFGAIVTTFATGIITFPERLFDDANPAWYAGAVVMFLSLGIGFFSSLGLYTIVPVARPNWRHVWKGAFVAGLLFVLLGQLFPLYLRLTDGFSAFGQTIAFALILLLWFYLLGQIIVIGAEVNALLGGQPAQPPSAEDVPAE